MIDPTNTLDGTACHLCGEAASGTDNINGVDLPTCDKCHEEQITDCWLCDRTIYVRDGIRLESPDLLCQSCYDQQPIAVSEMDQVRR